jgi:catechol-2,3-dioxygenase
MIDIQRIDHAALTVRDVAASTAFYQQLGFAAALAIPRLTLLRNGDAVVALFAAGEDAREGKARGPMDRAVVAIQHLAFRVAEGSLSTWKERLEAAGIATRGPVDHEVNRSLYFEDPDGHQLELTHPR